MTYTTTNTTTTGQQQLHQQQQQQQQVARRGWTTHHSHGASVLKSLEPAAAAFTSTHLLCKPQFIPQQALQFFSNYLISVGVSYRETGMSLKPQYTVHPSIRVP